jgi:hypothetical protein
VSPDRVALGELGHLETAAHRAKPLMDLRYQASVSPGTGPLGFGLSMAVPAEAGGVYVAR